MELYGNQSTYNIENVLRQNILSSEYFNDVVSKLTTWHEVVDEIYYKVTNVEPWLGGNARGASTAFCLLYRLCQLKLTGKQIKDTVNHSDSPSIRAIGFLYLRYVIDSKKWWGFVSNCLDDQEIFEPAVGGPPVTLGEFLRDIILNQFYFETLFPRCPQKVRDDFVEFFKSHGMSYMSKGNGGTGGPDRRGVEEQNKRPASVKASLSVAFSQKAPNRAGTKDDIRGRDNYMSQQRIFESGNREKEREDREKARAKIDEDRYRYVSKEDEKKSYQQRKPRSMSRDRSREKIYRRQKSRSRSQSMDKYKVRHRDRSRDRSRSYYSNHHKSKIYHRSHRSRSQSIQQYNDRGAKDVFKKRDHIKPDTKSLKDIYGDNGDQIINEYKGRAQGSEEIIRLGAWR